MSSNKKTAGGHGARERRLQNIQVVSEPPDTPALILEFSPIIPIFKMPQSDSSKEHNSQEASKSATRIPELETKIQNLKIHPAIPEAKVALKVEHIEEKLKQPETMTRPSLSMSRHNWATPPASPSQYISRGRQKERGESSQRNDLKGADLNLSDQQNIASHGIVGDEKGLGKWWVQNRREWIEQQVVVARLKEKIESIREQQRHPENAQNDNTGKSGLRLKEKKPDRLESEKKTLLRKLEKELNFFDNRHPLMEAVSQELRQFRQLRRGASDTKTSLDNPSVNQLSKGLDEIEFVSENGALITSISSFNWYIDRGFSGWLQEAKIGIQSGINEMERKILDSRSKFRQLVMLSEDVTDEIDELSAKQSSAIDEHVLAIESIENWITELQHHKRHNQEKLQLWEIDLENAKAAKNLHLKVYEENHEEKSGIFLRLELQKSFEEYSIVELSNRLQIKRSLLSLIERISLLPDKMTQEQDMKDCYTSLYNILLFDATRERLDKDVAHSLKNMHLRKSNTEDITASTIAHHFGNAHYGERVRRLLESIDVTRRETWLALQYAIDTVTEETLAFHDLLQSARKMIKTNQDTRKAINSRWDIANEAEETHGTRKSFRPANPSLGQAKKILKAKAQDLGGKWMEVGEVIRSFYISPDTAHIFQYIEEVPIENFIQLTNSFLVEEISPAVIEAFLIHCKSIQCYLFRYSQRSGNVSATDYGWEFVVERALGGGVRKNTVIPPLKVEELERSLVKYQHRLRFDSLDRDYSVVEIRERVSKIWTERDLSLIEIQRMLDYWHISGKFFEYLPNKCFKGQPIVRRIDNGWPVDGGSNYPELNLPLSPWFESIVQQIISDKNIPYSADLFSEKQFPTESELFTTLGGKLFVNLGFLRFKEIREISRHEFHIFLRTCTENKTIFRLYRSDQVQFVEKGWDPEGEEERREEHNHKVKGERKAKK